MRRGASQALVLVVILTLTGCEIEQRDDLEPARGPAAAPPAPPPPDIAAAEEDWPAHTLQVTNDSDREVLILAIVAGRVQELGTVAPGSAAGLSLRAREGDTVELEARDDQERLVAESSLTVGAAPLAWHVPG